MTTGGSIRKVLATVRARGAEVVGVTALVDRSGGQADLGVPMHVLAEMQVAAWEPASCPLWRKGIPVVEPKEPGPR